MREEKNSKEIKAQACHITVIPVIVYENEYWMLANDKKYQT